MAIDPPAVLGPQGMLKGGDQELLSGKDQAEHLNLCPYPCMKCHLDGAGQSFGAAGIGKCHWDELSAEPTAPVHWSSNVLGLPCHVQTLSPSLSTICVSIARGKAVLSRLG